MEKILKKTIRISIALLFLFAFTPSLAFAVVPGDTISDTSTYSYALGTWDGAYYAEVGVWVNGGGCAYNGGYIYSPGFSSQGYGPSSISTTCSVTAGSVGTQYTFTKWTNALGSGWVSSPGGTYTVSAPTCTSFTYTDWGACQPGGTQTRTVTSSSPSGCTGGSPLTSQTCTYVPPPTIVNGSCGSSDGKDYYSAPTSGLCRSGTASASGSWSWQCSGSGGGTTANCSAYQIVDCVGSWGTCSNGSQTYTITTSSANGGSACSNTNGATQSCGTPASCGSSNGGSFTSAPSSNLCSSGTTSSVSGSGPWSWSCISGNGGTSASCSASVAQASFSLSNFTVCDANTGGNCGGTIYGNGTGYYKVRITNSGGTGGTFNGYYTIFGGRWTGMDIYSLVGAGSYVDSSLGQTSGTGTYTFGACKGDGTGCTGGTSVTFISRPSLSGPSSVNSGSNATFTVSYDSARTPSYSGYSCGSGGTFVSSSGNQFTCRYTNTGANATTATASVTVTQGGISTSPSAIITVNPGVFTLTATPPSNGTISATGISCGSDCTENYTTGTVVSVTANPSAGYSFGSWGGACSGQGNPCSLTMDGNKSVTASFTQQPFNYSLSASANISVTAGQSGSNVITRTLTSGLTQSVTLSASIPSAATGASATILNNPANPSAGSSLTIYTSNGTPPDSYTVTITGSPLGNTTSFILSVLPRSVAKLSVDNFALVGTRMNSQQSFEQNTPLTYVARVSNTSSVAEAKGIFVYLQRGTTGNNYEDIPGATATWDSLAPNGSKNLVLSTTFPAGSWRIRSCVRHYATPYDNQGNPVDDCSSSSNVTFAPPPPPPRSYCVANINNAITGTSDWQNTASISISGCPSAEYQDMWVSGHSGSNEWTSDLVNGVFDVDSWRWRNWDPSKDSGAAEAMRTAETGCFQDVCYTGFTIGEPGVSVLGGFIGTRTYHVGDIGDTVYEKSILKRGGKYGYKTINGFSGNYVCYTQNISSYNQATQAVTTQNNPVKVPFSATANLMACIEQGGTGNYYKNSSCTQVDRSVGLFARANCTAGAVDIPFTATVSIPTQPAAPSFEHHLIVQSKLDGASQQGVNITEVSVSSAINFPPNYFAGITDYTKLAERNLTVVLEAPVNHSEVPTAVFTGWDNCTPVPGNLRQCSVSFAFTALGGQNKTIIANYSSNLDAPVVLTSPASCDANGGKVNVYLQSAVSGATGYHIYRSTSPFTAARKNWFNIAYAQGVSVELDSDNNPANGIQPFTTPPTQSNPFVDRNLSPNTQYYYRATAYNSSVTSPPSAQTSRAASLPCPDLVVEPGSVEIINTANPPQVISPTAVPSNTSIRFRAKIRNQNGAIVPSSQSFDNQFSLDGNITNLFAQSSIISLVGSDVSPLSQFITSVTAPVLTVGSHSLQVCADHPLPDKIREVNSTGDAETNNCLIAPFSFSVVAPITVELKGRPSNTTETFKDFVIVDYDKQAELKWTTTGNPSFCEGLVNWSGAKTPTAGGSELTLNLKNPLTFIYQLSCNR